MYKLTFYSPLEVYNHPLESFLNCRPTCFLVICADKEREGNSGSNRTHPLCAQSNLPLQVGRRVNPPWRLQGHQEEEDVAVTLLSISAVLKL